jgi:hypothetical protein
LISAQGIEHAKPGAVPASGFPPTSAFRAVERVADGSHRAQQIAAAIRVERTTTTPDMRIDRA